MTATYTILGDGTESWLNDFLKFKFIKVDIRLTTREYSTNNCDINLYIINKNQNQENKTLNEVKIIYSDKKITNDNINNSSTTFYEISVEIFSKILFFITCIPDDEILKVFNKYENFINQLQITLTHYNYLKLNYQNINTNNNVVDNYTTLKYYKKNSKRCKYYY